MVSHVVRFIKRFIVFLPGGVVAYLILHNIYPALNQRLPAAPAVLLAYLVAAYGLIPAGIRLVHLILRPRHVPQYSVTPDGFASDPVQIGLFGTEQEVIRAMKTIGWHQADKRTPRSLLRMGFSLVLKQPYANAPFSNLFLLGRHQDLGFQLPLDNNPRHRHHVRFWAVKPAIAEHFKEHIAFWHKHHQDTNPRDDRYLWLGAASLDVGLGFIRHNGQITHMIHPNTDRERELIVKSLKKAGLTKRIKRITITKPYQLRNRVINGYLETDGKLAICEL